MTTFFAQPYSTDYTGFYFDSPEAFDAGMKKLNQRGCEEVEIQFIDGEPHLCTLAKSLYIGQCDIEFWYENIEELDEEDATKVTFLIDCNLSREDALERFDEVYLFEGKAEDYAYELINDTTEIPESLRYYIDYQAIARDMDINGEIVELAHELIVTNPLDF